MSGLGLREMVRRTPPGMCPFCGDPARPKVDKLGRSRGTHFLTCGAPECKAAYHVHYGRDRRDEASANEATLTKLEKPRRDLVAERTRSTLSRAFSDTVLTHLIADGRYHLPGFGTFTLRLRPARQVRNPQTKELMWLPSTPEVRFRAAKKLKRGVTARLAARYPKEAA